jgi:DNA primase
MPASWAYGSQDGAHVLGESCTRHFPMLRLRSQGEHTGVRCSLEKANFEDGDALRKVAVGLQERYFPERASTRKRAAPAATGLAAPKALPVSVNAPLDFALKDLETDHVCLTDTGLTDRTIAHFGLGYCSRGMLKGRMAIPLHDADGKLVGYAGRAVDDNLIVGRSSEYIFPANREHAGRLFKFQKSLLLYNGHRAEGPYDDLIVVEWFPSVWWVHQNGYPHVVALMGSEYSEEQVMGIVSLVKPSGRVWLLLEGHQDGVMLAQSLLVRLSSYRFVRWVKINDGVRLTELDAQDLNYFFTV